MGQNKPLTKDDRGKLIYYEIVIVKNETKTSLIGRANAFFNKSAKSLKRQTVEEDSLIHATGKMILNKTALVLSRPSGEVLYNFYCEIRAGKYRFWMTDFNFIPYQRDRYGNFVRSKVKGVPLESNPGKLNAAEWSGYINAASLEANLLAERFKKAMAKNVIALPAVEESVSPAQKW